MQIAVILTANALPESYRYNAKGRLQKQQLLYQLTEGDLTALNTALSLKDEADSITAFGLGNNPSKAKLRQALAMGVDAAKQIKGDNWPADIPTQMQAWLWHYYLKQQYDLVILADEANDDSGLSCYLAQYMGVASINSVIAVEKAGSDLKLRRKLAKGERQELLAKMPVVLSVVPQTLHLAPPSLAGWLRTEEQAVAEIKGDYLALFRMAPAKATTSLAWQTDALAPKPQFLQHLSVKAPANERLDALINGVGQTRQNRLVQGSAVDCAAEIIVYLQGQGFCLAP